MWLSPLHVLAGEGCILHKLHPYHLRLPFMSCCMLYSFTAPAALCFQIAPSITCP